MIFILLGFIGVLNNTKVEHLMMILFQL